MWKVKRSKVHGSGVFAIKDIKKNTQKLIKELE